jgi:hypothetical protein
VLAFGAAGFISVIAALSASLTTMIVVRCALVPAPTRHKQRFAFLSDQVPMSPDAGPTDVGPAS